MDSIIVRVTKCLNKQWYRMYSGSVWDLSDTIDRDIYQKDLKRGFYGDHRDR